MRVYRNDNGNGLVEKFTTATEGVLRVEFCPHEGSREIYFDADGVDRLALIRKLTSIRMDPKRDVEVRKAAEKDEDVCRTIPANQASESQSALLKSINSRWNSK
jgi:hypothetical protein